MTTTFDWREPDDEPDAERCPAGGGERNEAELYKPTAMDRPAVPFPAHFTPEQIAQHIVQVGAAVAFVDRYAREPEPLRNIFKSLHPMQVPQGRSERAQQAREIWLYVRDQRERLTAPTPTSWQWAIMTDFLNDKFFEEHKNGPTP